jgi:hypothetical protein
VSQDDRKWPLGDLVVAAVDVCLCSQNGPKFPCRKLRFGRPRSVISAASPYLNDISCHDRRIAQEFQFPMRTAVQTVMTAAFVPQITLYRKWLREQRSLSFAGYEDLRQWSIRDIAVISMSLGPDSSGSHIAGCTPLGDRTDVGNRCSAYEVISTLRGTWAKTQLSRRIPCGSRQSFFRTPSNAKPARSATARDRKFLASQRISTRIRPRDQAKLVSSETASVM